jgi:Domain of unknown function (DUF1833)
MTRNITLSIRKELEAQFSTETNLIFLTISHDLLAQPIRVVNDTKDYIYGGDHFIGFPFDIQIYSDDEQPPRAQLTIQNVDSQIGESIRTLTVPPRLKLEMLSTMDFNTDVDPRVDNGSPTVMYRFDQAFLTNVKVDFLQVSAEIVGWNYLQRVWPGPRATQNIFPGLFA